jgi:hypothetical protein
MPTTKKTKPVVVSYAISYCVKCDAGKDLLDVPNRSCGHSDKYRRLASTKATLHRGVIAKRDDEVSDS